MKIPVGEIEIVLANAHKEQLNNSEVQKELQDVHKFFNNNYFPCKKVTFNFILLRSIYNHLERMMTVVGVFVNNTGKALNDLKGSIQFDLKEKSDVKFAKLDYHFPSDFLGELENQQGFIIHIRVPISGLSKEKQEFNATEIIGEVNDVKVTIAAGE